jgi:hypothetical protein
MAMAALAPLVASAKEHQILSKTLSGLAKGRKAGLLKSLLGGAGNVAKAFGFANQAQYTRKGGKSKKKNRGSGGGGRGPGAALPGGVTVQAGNAPIQFARTDEITNFFRTYPTKNGCMVHAAVQVAQVPTRWDTAGGAFTVSTYEVVNPAKTSYPWLSTFAALWKKHRVKNLRIHFQHYASTEAQGEVVIKYTPDPDDAISAQVEEQVCNGSNFLRGALYEDFMMECDLSGASKIPLDTDYTDNMDQNETALGQWAVYGNHYINPPAGVTSVLPGNIYIEMVIEFNDRFVPAADLALVRAVMRSQKHTREEKLKGLEVLLDREEASIARSREAVKREDPVNELLSDTGAKRLSSRAFVQAQKRAA